MTPASLAPAREILWRESLWPLAVKVWVLSTWKNPVVDVVRVPLDEVRPRKIATSVAECAGSRATASALLGSLSTCHDRSMSAVERTRRTSPLLLVGFVLVGGTCTHASVSPARPRGDGLDLRQVAAEMDDPSAARLWPMVPADLKARVAARIPASLSPTDGRRLGDNWLGSPNVTERCDGRDPQEPFLSFLAGWALLEDLAWSPSSAERLAAAGALYDRLRAEPFTSDHRQEMVMAMKSGRPATGPLREKWDRHFDRELCLGPVTALIAGHTIALERHFGAEILRGPPAAMTARVLRDEAKRRSEAREFQRALPLAAEAARLLPRTSDAWLELAKVSYQTDDVGRGDDALKRALALGADAGSRPARQALLFQALAHEPAPKGFDGSLSRFWALFEMGRLREARALVNRLCQQRPADARAFLGDVWLNYLERFWAGESYFGLMHASFLAFDGARNLTDRTGDYYRVYLSLSLQDAFASIWSALGAKRPIASDPAFAAAFGRARSLAKQFAPYIPDDAAIYELSADIGEIGLSAVPPRRSLRALGQLFPRALAVYAAHPCAESYRILLGLAMLTDDKPAAEAAIAAPLRFDLAGDEQLALFRARAFMSAAFRAKDWNRLQGAFDLLAAVPRSSGGTENELDVLRGDATMLRAVHGEQTLWTSAARQYAETSWIEPALDRDRAGNNALAIADLLYPGTDTAGYWSDLRADDSPEWPVLVNGAAAAFRAGRRAEAAAILRSRSLETDEQRPDYVADWVACLEGAPPKYAARPSVGDEPAVEIVDDTSKRADGFDTPFSWQLSAGLIAPPAKPFLQFSVRDVPWLIASPRLCWASRAVR